MKNDLTCGVVRDLLPSFVDGLTCPETDAAVEAHLAACPACARLREAMAAPEGEPAEQAKEVDYLKAVKRKNARRVAAAIVCTVLLLAAAFAAKVFIIGTPAQKGELVVMDSVEEDGALRLSLSTPLSAAAYWGWHVDTDGSIANISARSVLVSPLFPNGGAAVEIPLAGVTEVRLCGLVVWQNGVAIENGTARLYETKTPYVGDISALNRVAGALNIQSGCGPYLNSLQTSHEPYGWTLEFSNVYQEQEAVWLDNTMEQDLAPLMLALVDNLGEVSWTYQTQDGTTRTRTVTLAEADAALPRPVKDYAASAADLQQLLNLLMQ